ncbi:MAG: 5-oxoprolinase subunit PxpA [Alphaproteobacteria bacterium]|nr:5-oxoprolinase subunit PxpA [Alphaproteobacteria bacterium]
MAQKVNINADMGEGHGAYDIGNDAALLKIVRSANVACGFHGGDASVMHGVVTAAKAEGVSIGAHPSFNDLWGFGRRQIDMDATELEHMVAYQIGALMAMASYAGLTVTHVKAHGALNNMACVRPDYAMAIGRAIKTVDPGLINLVLPNTELEKAGEELGLVMAREAFVDRLYEDDATLTSRKIQGAVIKDPAFAAERVVNMVRNQVIYSRHGKEIPAKIDSLCVHGDEPTALAVAEAARKGLEDAGIEIVPLPEMIH